MFTVSTVQDCIFGRVGIRSSGDPDVAVLSSDVTASASGLYVNDEHPLLTVDNIENCAPQFNKYDLDAWSGSTTYALGAKVLKDGTAYKSLQAGNLNKDPATESAYWVTLLSEWLEDKMKSCANRLISELSVSKKINREHKSLIESLRLFRGAGRISNVATNNSKFVGFEIDIKKHNSLKAKFHKIGLQLSQAQDLTIYLFHSSQEAYVQKKTVTVSTANKFEWLALDWELDFVSDTIDSGGVYYIGYFQDDLTGSAIIKETDWSAGGGCSSCDDYNHKVFQQYNKYIDFEAIEATPNGTNIWDLADTTTVFSTNHGMNFEISVYCDVSRIICQQVHVLDTTYSKMMAVDLLKMMAHSMRNNDHAKKIMTRDQAAMIYHELEGNEYSIGIVREYKRSLKALEFDFSSIDKVCFPCQKKTVKYITR